MAGRAPLDLGKRERQIAEAVYRLGEASVAQVLAEIPDPPSYSAVRAMLTLLVDKKVLKLRQEGKKYLYRPATSPETTRKSALSHLVQTFFGGRPTDAVAALLDLSSGQLSDDDLTRMQQLIDQARKEQP